MTQLSNSRIDGRLKTIFIIAASVPGDRSAEANAVYYRGIIQPYEMTFNPNGAKRFSTRAQAEAFRKTLEGPHRFTVVEHVLYRQVVK